jgi:hypothetical protein
MREMGLVSCGCGYVITCMGMGGVCMDWCLGRDLGFLVYQRKHKMDSKETIPKSSLGNHSFVVDHQCGLLVHSSITSTYG